MSNGKICICIGCHLGVFAPELVTQVIRTYLVSSLGNIKSHLAVGIGYLISAQVASCFTEQVNPDAFHGILRIFLQGNLEMTAACTQWYTVCASA